MNEPARVTRARAMAMAAHHGQLDKAGNPYVGHLSRVAGRVRKAMTDAARPDIYEDAVVVAWLHDVVEDTDATLDGIQARFGQRVRDAVDAITRRPHEPRADYYARVRADEIALAVKLADIAGNTDHQRLAALEPDVRERLVRKYDDAVAALTGTRTGVC